MTCIRRFVWLLAMLGLFSVSNVFFAQAAPPAQSQHKEVTVWVNTRSGVYHCPGDRWYGSTKQGKYVGECKAIKEGDRPAYGKSCGSDCSKSLSHSSGSVDCQSTLPTIKF